MYLHRMLQGFEPESAVMLRAGQKWLVPWRRKLDGALQITCLCVRLSPSLSPSWISSENAVVRELNTNIGACFIIYLERNLGYGIAGDVKAVNFLHLDGHMAVKFASDEFMLQSSSLISKI